MEKEYKQIISLRLIYSVFKSFILIFVNIYLWKTSKNIKFIAIFNSCNYIFAFLSFCMANKIALRNMKANYILSSISFISLFIMTAILKENIYKYSFVIGILGGCGDGMFFFNLNYFQANKVAKENADKFVNVLGIVNKISTIATPLISGLVIEKYGFIYMVYTLIALLLIQLANITFISKDKINSTGNLNIKRLKNKKFLRSCMTNFLLTPCWEFSIICYSIVLYNIFNQESIIGGINSTFSIVAIVFYFIYIKVVDKVGRKRMMLIGVISITLGMSFLIKIHKVSFLVYGALYVIGDCFFNKPMVGIQLYSTRKYADDLKDLFDNLIIRAFFLTLGRIVFYSFLYLFYIDRNSSIFKFFLMYNMIIPYVSYRLIEIEIND